MITKYRIRSSGMPEKIEVVFVLRETAKSVFLPMEKSKSFPEGERREQKVSDWVEYYNTWNDAHAALLSKAEARINKAQKELNQANELAEKIKGMKPPASGLSD